MTTTTFPALQEFVVADEITAFFACRLERYQREGFVTPRGHTSTVNGTQTPNILTLEDPEVSSQLLALKEQIEQETKLRFDYHWVHLIDYEPGGFQKLHDHTHNEDYSFILYLESSESGQTRFLLNPDAGMHLPVDVFPEKNRLVLFLSQMRHEGRPVGDHKKVLVGGLKLAGAEFEDDAWTLGPRTLPQEVISLSDDVVPAMAVGMILGTKVIFDGEGGQIKVATVASPTGEMVGVTAATLTVLAKIDGRRTLRQIVAELGESGPGRFTRDSVVDCFRRLIDAEIVELPRASGARF